MNKKPEKRPPLEEGLITAMQAVDNQIAREMQRSPAEAEAHGVQKWEPYQKRIETVCSFVLNSLGEEEVGLDSLLVLSQAFTKALLLVVEDLGHEGLGKIRGSYTVSAGEQISKDADRILKLLRDEDLM